MSQKQYNILIYNFKPFKTSKTFYNQNLVKFANITPNFSTKRSKINMVF